MVTFACNSCAFRGIDVKKLIRKTTSIVITFPIDFSRIRVKICFVLAVKSLVIIQL